MSEQVSKSLRIGGGIASFWCPGCDGPHSVRIDGPSAWGYNGNPDAPTFTPSILVTNGHYTPGHKDGDACWCEMPNAGFKCARCHSFVTDGRIQFLDDSTHELAGQTVPLGAWPEVIP